jgi:hypothetical protein
MENPAWIVMVAGFYRVLMGISSGWWFGTMDFYDFPY